MTKTAYHKIEPYITKDGSVIRELMHPNLHHNTMQSLAEAIVPAGAVTELHIHHHSEEIYHVTEGCGRMTLANEEFSIKQGDTICIAPGTPHRLENSGPGELRLLCCCSPPYRHEDTELLKKS